MANSLPSEPVRLRRDGLTSAPPIASFLSGFQSMPSMGQMRQTPQLPDFAHRPGKYSYEEWKDRPELIPKGRSYYEHDDRDAGDSWQDSWSRGGRGGGRGRARGFTRGMGRGSFESRRRPFRPRSPFSGGEWKHDKFEELESENMSSQPVGQ